MLSRQHCFHLCGKTPMQQISVGNSETKTFEEENFFLKLLNSEEQQALYLPTFLQKTIIFMSEGKFSSK